MDRTYKYVRGILRTGNISIEEYMDILDFDEDEKDNKKVVKLVKESLEYLNGIDASCITLLTNRNPEAEDTFLYLRGWNKEDDEKVKKAFYKMCSIDRYAGDFSDFDEFEEIWEDEYGFEDLECEICIPKKYIEVMKEQMRILPISTEIDWKKVDFNAMKELGVKLCKYCHYYDEKSIDCVSSNETDCAKAYMNYLLSNKK